MCFESVTTEKVKNVEIVKNGKNGRFVTNKCNFCDGFVADLSHLKSGVDIEVCTKVLHFYTFYLNIFIKY